MTSLTIDDFAEFFAAANGGRRPFAWQVRLLERLATTGRWPDVIDSPTGSGKSSVIDVHLFATALASTGGTAASVPRRLVITVDRRALVDGHWDHAMALQRALAEAPQGILHEVSQALVRTDYASAISRANSDPGQPFLVSRIRGGEVADRDWVQHPAACQVIAATPDMIGSRLLFRGYGTSRLARPREAGLLAFDTVFVVGEAHMNSQLIKTLNRVGQLAEPSADQLGVPRLQVVGMTATPPVGGETTEGVRQVDLDSNADLLLRARLLTPKPVTIIRSPNLSCDLKPNSKQVEAGADAIAEATLRMLESLTEGSEQPGPGTVGCIVNTVKTAQLVAARLRQALSADAFPSPRLREAPPGEVAESRATQVVTIVGRMRPHDLGRFRTEHPGLFTLEGDATVAVVVATQTLEVGVDMDFAGLVTELAPGSAVAQRAGRVNRSGKRRQAPVWVLCPQQDWPPERQIGPYTGSELAEALAWLNRCRCSPDGLAAWRLHPQGGNLVPPRAQDRRPVFQRVETWDVSAWQRTSDELAAEPWLDLWLADSLDEDLSVGFVVREGLPEDSLSARYQVDVTRPLPDEVFPCRLIDARSILRSLPKQRAVIIRNDDISVAEGDDVTTVTPHSGDIYVVDSLQKLTTESVLTADGADATPPGDVGELAGVLRPGSHWARIGLQTPVGQDLGTEITSQILQRARQAFAIGADTGDDGVADEIRETLRERLREVSPSRESLSHRLQVLENLIESSNRTDIIQPSGESPEDYWIVIQGKTALASDEASLQTRSFASTTAVELAAHQAAVAAEAKGLTEQIGLTGLLQRALESAGGLHDEGKRDARFQRSLRRHANDHQDKVLAKSGMRSRELFLRARRESGLPQSWRHEQLSAVTAWSHLGADEPEIRDIVTRLVGTSHGHGRHEFPHVGRTLLSDNDPQRGTSSTLFDDGEWEEILRRTDRRYGPWGCAYLEALLRAADGVVSRSGS